MSDSCQYLQTGEYRASCKQGAMLVLDSWYRAEGWRGTGIVQPLSWDKVSVKNRLRSNASTEPVDISVLAWHRCPIPRQYRCRVPCQYRWTTSSQVTLRSRNGGRPCLCQNYASTAPVLQILLRYWRGTKQVVNFHLPHLLAENCFYRGCKWGRRSWYLKAVLVQCYLTVLVKYCLDPKLYLGWELAVSTGLVLKSCTGPVLTANS